MQPPQVSGDGMSDNRNVSDKRADTWGGLLALKGTKAPLE
jgi:hypothetical protein